MIHMENLLTEMKTQKKVQKKKKKKSTTTASSRGKADHQQQHSMKVVYISNPMKFEIRASEFRSLVQELTGRHADFPPSLRRHRDNSSLDSNCSSPTTTTTTTGTTITAAVDSGVGGDVAPSPEGGEEVDHETHPPPAAFEEEEVMLREEDDDDYLFDGEEFVPEMLENAAVFHSWHLGLILPN